MQEMLPGAHIERVRDVKGSIAYAQKVESRVSGPFTYGCRGSGGEKLDIVRAVKVKRVEEIVSEHPSLWYRVRSLQLLRSVSLPKRDCKTELYYVFGKSGCGKTLMVSRMAKYMDVYFQDGSKWWTGYEQEPLVVVDEYHGQFDTRFLLKLGDYTPFHVETKGGYVQFNSEAVVFLSNLPPEDTLFSNVSSEVVIALKRRFRIIEYV